MVVRFVVDNPGWWLFHCHTQMDQSAGMTAVIQELFNELSSPGDDNSNTCMPIGSASSLSLSSLVIIIIIDFTWLIAILLEFLYIANHLIL